MKNVRIALSFVFMTMLLVVTMLFPLTALTQDATPTPVPTLTSVPPVPRPEGSTEVVFWYGLGGLLGNVVQETVNLYNQSQSTYYVNAVFQASYDDTVNRITAGLASGELPDLAQVFEAGTQRMIDTGRIIPVQTLFERDGLQAVIDDMEPSVRDAYTIDGVMYSAPFNTSTPMLYIDRAAFAAASLDPDQPLVTFDQVAEYARALTVRDANGNVTRYGIGLCGEGWYLEQTYISHNQFLGLPENGRAGRMEQYAFNTELGVQFLEWQKSMVDEGIAVYYGGCGPVGQAFVNGEIAMAYSSIAALRTFVAGAESAGRGVEVGVLFIPRNEGEAGKTTVGGASLWITNVGTPEAQEGAWDFIKWSLQPEVQAFWAANTGYYPVVQAAYDLPEMQEALERFPQFQVAIDQLRLSEPTNANSFHLSGVYLSYRQAYIQALDAYMTGQFATAQEALDSAVANANELLEEYNSTVAQ